MHILLTNDDGIHAKGLHALYDVLAPHYMVSVVAPESEQSAVGHAITLLNPLRVREIRLNKNFLGLAVSGTPADCVKIAINEILDTPPDIVLSGINLGANVGINVLYSGTVSAATEGAILGIPSIAVSLNTFKDPDFSFAAHFIRKLIRRVTELELNPATLLNVNIPAVPPEDIRGIALTRQGISRFVERFDKRIDPRDNVYYWQAGETHFIREGKDIDTWALSRNLISITPLHFDLTNHAELNRMRQAKILKDILKS
ncbi:MAG: 5'/3'-nucleotidase SurE [Deltaproteobacteria bacterium]|nr:5'/3'-nucleotidase SurE [Deltaproteobacteria bacterium]